MKKFVLTLLVLLFSIYLLHAQIRIKMQKENGVYTAPCLVNGLRLRFIFDTGASNVSISISEATFMLKNGYLQESDLKGSSHSQIANGNIVENTIVNLKELEIGGLKLYNVEAIIIHELTAPLLLGQSAIEKLGKIQLENDELVIVNSNLESQEGNCLEAKLLASKAITYYFDNLYTLAVETYQKAYDLCPDAIDCLNIDFMGSAYFYSENYQLAIKFLEKAAACTKDSGELYFIYHNIGNSYREINDNYNALKNLEKCLLYAKDDKNLASAYFSLAFTKHNQNKFDDAIKDYEKSTIYQLKTLSATIDDVMRGAVKDAMLGETLWNSRLCYNSIGSYLETDSFAAAAAQCGYQEAIGYCNRYGINFKNFKKK